ncbi:hypothetical protein WN55_00506 [Dufourea novaeangliae]|uniref:Uncharacterized protein n=1 Tax=Dufourea novaeangliae TaxID=178035 RepID=A0A154PF57_DUFNO|nr:hypothetical protein WN55_00506 [Dufourea novaeangliae]
MRRGDPADAGTAARSKRFVGEVIELDRARPPSSRTLKPLRCAVRHGDTGFS